MIRTNLCPRCKSDERLTPKMYKEILPELLEKTPEMALFKIRIPDMQSEYLRADSTTNKEGFIYIDICARCGTLYCYKYTIEGTEIYEVK